MKQIVYSVLAGVVTLAVSSGAHELKPWHYRRSRSPTTPRRWSSRRPARRRVDPEHGRSHSAPRSARTTATSPVRSPTGRREINWDGGGSTATSPVPTPFDGFLVTRGASFTTPGTGFVQAPLDGLATTFNNADLRDDLPGVQPGPAVQRDRQQRDERATSSCLAAATSPRSSPDSARSSPTSISRDGLGLGRRPRAEDRTVSTSLRFYDVHGRLLYSSAVPPSPGDASLSFFGVVFQDARIARVKIVSGDVRRAPTMTSARTS